MDNHPHNQEQDREARIRECAYHLWETNGKPYGRDVEFWQRARQIVAEQDHLPAPAEAAPVAPTPAAPAAATRRRRPATSRKPRSS